MEGDGVDGVDLVALGVEVGVEPVHHHHHLVGLGPTLLRVDDERPVEPARDVLGQRPGVAVVEVQAERLGGELVRRLAAGLDQPGADPGHAVHLRRVQAVEVDRVRVLGAVDEADPQQLALARAQRRAGHRPVVRPGWVLDPGSDLDLLVAGDQGPLPQHAAAGEPPRLPPVEVAEEPGGMEAVGLVIDDAALPEGRPGVAAAVDRARCAVSGAVGGRGPGQALVQALVRHELVQRRDRGAGRRAPDEELPA